MKVVIRKGRITKSLHLCTISVFILYAFWFQYAFSPINKFMIVMGGLMILSSIINIRRMFYYKAIAGIIFFLLYTIIFGYLVSYDWFNTSKLLINNIEYLIPMVSILTFVSGSWKKLKIILWLMSTSIVLLSISTLINARITNTGAITIGELNTNVLSSFLTILLFCCLLLYSDIDNSFIIKIILGVMIILGFIIQIKCASRRGFLIYIFLLLTGAYSFVHSKYKNKPLNILMITLAAIIVLGIVTFVFLQKQDSIVLLQRFGDLSEQGDYWRAQYQAAAWQLFQRSPLFGTGLGYVSLYAGMYSHSLYYELLACTGITGTAIMIIYLLNNIIFYCRKVISLKDETSIIKIRGYVVILFIISIFISGIAVVYIYDMYFYIMLALIAAERNTEYLSIAKTNKTKILKRIISYRNTNINGL